MAKFMSLKINNSKKASIKSGQWKDPGAKLYDQLLNAYDNPHVNRHPDYGMKDPETKYDKDFLKEAYLVAPVEKIKNSPYGVTPYVKSGCEFPHHVIKNGELVVHVDGLKKAYEKAWRDGILKDEVKRHLQRHMTELKLEIEWHHGRMYWNESNEIQNNIQENFNYIESYIAESNSEFQKALKLDMYYEHKFLRESTIQEGNTIRVHFNHLPESFQKKILETNKKIIQILKKKIKEEKYQRLNEGYIIDELVKVMSTGDYVGYTMVYKNKSRHHDYGHVFITDAQQEYEFYETHRKNQDPTKTYVPIYQDYVRLLKDIEKELKPEFNGDKNKFILLGDPIDQIHQFEFILCKETAKELWDWLESNKRKENRESIVLEKVDIINKSDIQKKINEDFLWIESFVYDNDFKYPIREVTKKDATSAYLINWLFKFKEWEETSPDEFNISEWNDPIKQSFIYGYFIDDKIEGFINIYKISNGCYQITNLFVNPIQQSKGIGQKLFQFILEKFKGNVLRLQVKKDKHNAIHIYKKYGFNTIEEYVNDFDKEVYLDMRRDADVIKEGVKVMDDLDWMEKYLIEEGESVETPPSEVPPPKEEVKKESLPKKTDAQESDKNGVRRKKLYIAFIEWAKEYNSKNTFGSVFDKDAFHTTYPFVPDEMRYFYRLANPMLCVLAGELTFFAVAELRKLNIKNSRLSEMMIFAATKEDVRVFNKKDKKVYRGIEENGMLKLAETLGDTFDIYIQKMINKGDILNAPLEEDNPSSL